MPKIAGRNYYLRTFAHIINEEICGGGGSSAAKRR